MRLFPSWLVVAVVAWPIEALSASVDWDAGPLGKQAAALGNAYEEIGDVVRLAPRLVERQQAFPIVLPEHLVDPNTESCATVTVLTSPNISFVLLFNQPDTAPARRAWPVPSGAGAAEVTRCGARKSLLTTLELNLRSVRGVAEFLVVESENPPPPVGQLLPSRNPGPSLSSPRVGRRPWLAPLAQRVANVRERSRREKAESIEQSAMASDPSGRGSALVHLAVGCHRLQLLPEANPNAPPDVDAHLLDLATGHQVAADDEHSAAATLELCVGRPRRFRLDFTGAEPKSELLLIQSSWSIPTAFPVGWGALARSRLARAAWREGLDQFQRPPSYSSMGVRGTTRLSVPTDPHACYVAVVAKVRGDVTSLAMGAKAGSSTSEAHGEGDEGATLSFCAQGSTRTNIEVQAVGTGLAWIAGIWRMGKLK